VGPPESAVEGGGGEVTGSVVKVLWVCCMAED
jgi:hypothetical protein